MPEAYWSPELHDERAGTTYPLAGPAPITSDDRLVTLEPGTFLDATVHPVGGGAGLRITRVDVEPGVVRLVIGTQALPDLGAATFDPFDPPDRLELTDGYGRAAGLLLCDPGLLAAAQGWPAGVHPFRAGRSEFVATCTIPAPAPRRAGSRRRASSGRSPASRRMSTATGRSPSATATPPTRSCGSCPYHRTA
jgi:hypothetical protein